jgi:UDP-N-acetylglucosamine diphosphorylase/glucosamine-1-phosphate N-acetyltransferase
MNLNVIIMAGGLGKRMESNLPKVLHISLGKPMIIRVIEQASKLSPKKIIIVVGKYKDIIQKTIESYLDMNLFNIVYVFQEEALGTGHAVQCCMEELKKEYSNMTLILSGDVPLLKSNTMNELIKDNTNIKIIVSEFENPTGYGRIIETNDGVFDKILEEKDCNEEEKKIKKCNCGVYAINTNILCKYLPCLTNNNSQKEYYLTDIIEIIKINEKMNIEMLNIPKEKQYEIIGVNTKQQLVDLEKIATNML